MKTSWNKLSRLNGIKDWKVPVPHQITSFSGSDLAGSIQYDWILPSDSISITGFLFQSFKSINENIIAFDESVIYNTALKAKTIFSHTISAEVNFYYMGKICQTNSFGEGPWTYTMPLLAR